MYAYKARLANDIYNTTAPPGVAAPLGPPTGSQSGLVTTASLPFIMPTGANTGSVNTVSGLGSTDPQIDTVVISGAQTASKTADPIRSSRKLRTLRLSAEPHSLGHIRTSSQTRH